MQNSAHFFVLVAASTMTQNAAACRAASARGGDEALCAEQIRQARRGVCGSELVRSIRGWSVRADSGTENFAIRYRAASLADAVRWAKAWAAESPEKRTVWVRRSEKFTSEERVSLGMTHTCLVCGGYYTSGEVFEEPMAGNDTVCVYCQPTGPTM